MGQYAKSIAAFFTSLGTWGATALADGRVSGPEWFGLCGVVVATAAVWQVTNTAPVVTPPTPVMRTVKKKAKSSKGQIDLGTAIVIAVLLVLVFAVVFGVPNR